MKKIFKVVILITIIFLISSCHKKPPSAPTPPPEEPYETYEPKDISLHIKADAQLNLFQERPHTLRLCIYQFTEPSVFNQLINDISGLTKLLECERFDQSAAGFHQLTIHPGEEITKSFDRSEGAKYVAIVAGYYSLVKEKVTRFYKIPVTIQKTGRFIKKEKVVIEPFNIDLYLGPEGIR